MSNLVLVFTQTRGKGPPKEEKDKWLPPEGDPDTPSNTRLLMAAAYKTAIEFFMTHHLYTFGGKVKKQEEGGSIGAALTVQISRIVMRFFDRLFFEAVKAQICEASLNSRYVNDVLVVLLLIDITNQDKTPDQLQIILINKLSQVADNIINMLEFTCDFPASHRDGWMPVLDTQVRAKND